MFDRKIKVYPARAMTGRVKEEVVAEAAQDKEKLEKAGFVVLCPVISENVPSTKQTIRSSKKAMDSYWPRDKEMIREAHVVFNMSPHVPSIGVIRESGYSRYFLWKKTISVFPKGKMPLKSAICYYEDDFVTDNLDDAIAEALRTHGTYWRRLKWRMSIYNQSLFRAIYYKFMEWIR